MSAASLMLGLVMVVAAIGTMGCGDAGYPVVPVKGKVTLDGQPLAGAVISFQPIDQLGTQENPGSGSFGRTNELGEFEMRLIDPDQPGAAIGRHVVTITTATSAGGDAGGLTGERVPQRYRDGSFTYEVPTAGTDRAQLDLTTK